MSQHPSFGKPNKGAQKKNVLKRFERVKLLKQKGRFNATRVTGLPKTASQ